MRRITIVAALAALTGCATGPKWVRNGTSAFPASDRVFYGVGQADAGIEDKELRMEAADNRARADLQKYFDTYSGYLMQQYGGPDGNLVERAIKTFSAGHISGIRIVEHFEKREKVYALARLDLEEFRRVMKGAPELTDKARKFLLERSEKLFDEMRKMEIRDKAEK